MFQRDVWLSWLLRQFSGFEFRSLVKKTKLATLAKECICHQTLAAKKFKKMQRKKKVVYQLYRDCTRNN
jgi:hypothetical protein